MLYVWRLFHLCLHRKTTRNFLTTNDIQFFLILGGSPPTLFSLYLFCTFWIFITTMTCFEKIIKENNLISENGKLMGGEERAVRSHSQLWRVFLKYKLPAIQSLWTEGHKKTSATPNSYFFFQRSLWLHQSEFTSLTRPFSLLVVEWWRQLWPGCLKHREAEGEVRKDDAQKQHWIKKEQQTRDAGAEHSKEGCQLEKQHQSVTRGKIPWTNGA